MLKPSEYPQNFLTAYKMVVIPIEGGYSNDPDDPGGETNRGLTKRTLRALGYQGSVKGLTEEEAMYYYYIGFWTFYRLDKIKELKIAVELFDQIIHFPYGVAGKHLQRAYNLLAYNQTTLKVDGIIGSKTIAAVNSYQYQNDLYDSLNGLQHMRYIEECERNPKQRKYYRGFLKRTRNFFAGNCQS